MVTRLAIFEVYYHVRPLMRVPSIKSWLIFGAGFATCVACIFAIIFCYYYFGLKLSGIGPYERLGWYVPFVPQTLVVEKFYESPSPAMDHEYMWKIKIDSSEQFQRFWKQFSSAPPNAEGASISGGPAVFDYHPVWWREIDFKRGVSFFMYRISVVGSGGGEKADVFALFDKDAGCVYIQAY